MPELPHDHSTPQSPDQPRRVMLWVSVPTEAKQAATRIARDYARLDLEAVLAAFVGDLAVAAERPGSWEHERVTSWLASHVWEVERENRPCRLREDEVMGCTYGDYPWDGWQRWALAHGVPAELATLGRAVIREADQHGWDERLKSLCGWRDDGRRMLRLALRNPALAQKRWSRLLDTDGGRYDPATGRVT